MPKERLTGFQMENLATCLCWDDKHGRLVASMTDPALFEGELQVIAQRAIDYWRQYNEAPKHHTADLFAAELGAGGGRAQTFRRLLMGMHVLHPEMNADYVLNDLRTFTRKQTVKAAIIKGAELISRNAPDEEVERTLAEAIRGRDTTFDAGTAGDDYASLLAHLEQRSANEFVTGIDSLDRRQAVPARETIMVFLGVTSAGKSWFLVQLGRQALLRDKRVAHVTLELSEHDTMQRYYQNLLGVPLREERRRNWKPLLRKDANGCLLDVERQALQCSFSMQEPDRRKLQELAARSQLRNLRIKRFPTRGLTVAQLRGWLDGLQAFGFSPDLLLVDYVGLMHTEPDEYRITLGRLVEELRGLAVERKMALATAQQVNREGKRASQVRIEHVAEDWSIPGTVDCVLAFSRSDEEQRLKLARLRVEKMRHGEQGYSVVLAQNYDCGQFAHDCAWPGAGYLALVERLDAARQEQP
jgi:KaiC/GvpD/RAD55 family RecA-like ATPase